MRFQNSSSEYGEGSADSHHGDADRGQRTEQCLYGEPCHEVQPSRDEQTLYGEPQHETREDDSELPDLELLFARMGESNVRLTLSDRSSASRIETTEQ